MQGCSDVAGSLKLSCDMPLGPSSSATQASTLFLLMAEEEQEETLGPGWLSFNAGVGHSKTALDTLLLFGVCLFVDKSWVAGKYGKGRKVR